MDGSASSASALAVSRARWTREGEAEDESVEKGAELLFRFAQSHAESTARALSIGAHEDEDEDEDEDEEGDAKCMIYVRGVRGATSVRLTRVAAWPNKSSSSVSFTGDWDEDGVNGAGDTTSASGDAEGVHAIDLDAPQETLAAQKTFDLPSANAVVACLTYEDSLVGLIVVERARRSSASARARARSPRGRNARSRRLRVPLSTRGPFTETASSRSARRIERTKRSADTCTRADDRSPRFARSEGC